jgi:alkaline phosphatase D
MRELLFLFIISISLNGHAQTNYQRLQNLKDIERISFGSCNNQGDAQPLWNDLIKQKPDLWIWGGDNIYADWFEGRDIASAYAYQNRNPKYQLFKTQTPIIGTWDDHDFGFDNANGEFDGKKESQRLHLNFLEVPQNSPIRQQEGIYATHEFGTESRKIKIIILDNRYFKGLDPEYPLLGKTQWEWLESELTNSPAKIHFIVTGLPVLSPLIPYTEEWGHTNELNRMLSLLKRTKPKGVVFLTGDKHFSSIYRRWGHLEFMSSGMTHITPRRTWFYLRQQYPTTFFGLSYGQIDISWEEEIPTIKLSMRTTSGKNVNLLGYKWGQENWRPVNISESGN